MATKTFNGTGSTSVTKSAYMVLDTGTDDIGLVDTDVTSGVRTEGYDHVWIEVVGTTTNMVLQWSPNDSTWFTLDAKASFVILPDNASPGLVHHPPPYLRILGGTNTDLSRVIFVLKKTNARIT